MKNNIKYGVAAVLIFAAIAFAFILWCIGTFDDNAGYEEFPAETWEAPAVRYEGLKVQSVTLCIEPQEAPADEPEQVTSKLDNFELSTAFEAAEPIEVAASQVNCYDSIPLSAELQTALFAACDEFRVDYALALGLIQTESRFNPYVVSCSGCYGLCQLNPVYFPSGLSPADNIRYGIQYLARQINVYGSIPAGLTAYNAGHDTGDRTYANVVLGYAAQWEGAIT